MVVAPSLVVPSFEVQFRFLTKEITHVVDDSGDSASTLVNRISWSHRRWIDPPSTRDRAHRVHHQPGLRAKGRLDRSGDAR